MIKLRKSEKTWKKKKNYKIKQIWKSIWIITIIRFCLIFEFSSFLPFFQKFMKNDYKTY